MRFLPLFLFLLLARTGFAAPLPAFEGTLVQTQNGAVTRAKIAWQPPESLQIEVEADAEGGIAAQTVVARGDETFLIWPATRRVQRYPFNIAKAWWRGFNLQSGGPANFLFAATPFQIAPTEGRFLRRDDVLFGGGGRNSYYAAIKTPARRFAAQVAVSPTSRIEKNDAGKVIAEAKITLDAQNLPQSAELVAGGEKSTFSYALQPRNAAFPATMFAVPADAIRQDIELRAPSSYRGDDADALFNRGAALAAANEDFPAALALWDAAAKLKPDASAPLLAIFETALDMRDLPRAARALEGLQTGAAVISPAEWGARAARLALARRDFAGAQSALDAALGSLKAPSLYLQRADIARGSGDIASARAIWKTLLSSPATPRATQVTAAQNYAIYATPDELESLETALGTATGEALDLARTLLQLRAGKAPAVREFTSDAMQISLALALQRAARDEEAAAAWQILLSRGGEALQNRARLHLMILAAQRGDVASSLSQWRAWNDALASRAEREAAQTLLFEAWQKAFRRETLGLTLANRAAATAATDADLRLFWAYQQLYGSDEETAAALESGAARFPDSAFWMGKKAESLVNEANLNLNPDRREVQYDKALDLIDKAVAAAPDEPFYRFQRALVATQRGAKTGGVIDASRAVKNRARAKTETERLLADLPGDPDALISAALQNLAFEGESYALEGLRLATLALDSAPRDGERHTFVWAARQALAMALNRLNRPSEAAAQWQILLAGARNAGEQGTLAGGTLGLLEANRDARGAARLLARLAGEPWGYSASRALLDAALARAAVSPLADAISGALLAANDAAATLAAATLAVKRLDNAQRALEAPEAPPAADGNLARATRDAGVALERLRPVAEAENRIVAARAAALLAENAELPDEGRLALLRRAIEVEPRDAALRLALIGALPPEEAAKERQIAARTLDFDLETRRQLANAARRGGDVAGALQIGEETFAAATRAPETDTNTWQRMAFSLAKTAFDARQNSRALDLYTGLSLPQWNPIDRAAALLALRRGYQETGRSDEATALNPKIIALGLTREELETALAFADEVEN